MAVATSEEIHPTHPQLGQPTSVYRYQRASGDTAFIVCRFDPKTFRPAQRRNGHWIWNLEGAPILPYRLPEIEDALRAGDTIWIVDGEKDVDALAAEGVTATCCARSQGWTIELAEQLTGARRIRVVADRDESGIGLRQANEVRDALVESGAIASCDIELIEAATGKDAYDHLEAGHGLDEFLIVDSDELQALDEPAPIIFEPLRDFLKRALPENEALVGVTREGTNLLPRYGWVMPWGREGSGKTSILVDLIFHACSGIDWLTYTISRKLKIVAIVNEGVPGGLQDKLAQKVECWEGDTDHVLDNLAIYASPWGEFTFRNEQMVAHARAYAQDFQADYVALDPLHTLGTTGAGTPAETEEFKHLLRNFGLWNDLGILTAHHSNKTGMVSGDWGRHTDTLFHLEKDGRQPATKLTLQKARPANPTELGVPYLLEWLTDTLSYKRVDLQTTSSFNEQEALNKAKQILQQATQPLGKDHLVKAIGGTAEPIRQALNRWLKDGQIIDLTPEHRSFKLTLPSSVEQHPTQPDATNGKDAQTRMAMPSTTVEQHPTQPDATQNQPTSASSVGRRPPYRGETEDDGTERANNDDTNFDDNNLF